MKKLDIRSMAFAAVFAAVMVICAQIVVPTPWGVPYTMQILAIALCGYALSVGPALSAIAVYIALGAVGLPVFSSFGGGIGILAGATGGYIWGFLLMTACCTLARRKKYLPRCLYGILGVMLCHIAGAIQFAVVTDRTFWQSFLLASAPYLLKDCILTAAAAYAAPRLKIEK